MLRVGVLASGSGTNFQALQDACAVGYADAKIEMVISNQPGAQVLERATRCGVKSTCLPRKGLSSTQHDEQILAQFTGLDVDLICCAGYMRILGRDFVKEFENRILNIHPSLLPSFPGLNAVEQALEWGVKTTGATVHIVDADLDSGPIIIQKSIDVEPRGSLEHRIHLVEYEIYPRALALWAKSAVRVVGRNTEISESIDPPPWAGSLPPSLTE